MSMRQETVNALQESGWDWRAPVVDYGALDPGLRGTDEWATEQNKVLYKAFLLKLFGFRRLPQRNLISINKKPWLCDRYASSLDEGLLEQVVAEEAARAYRTLNPLETTLTGALSIVLDEYPAACQHVPQELVQMARKLGCRTGCHVHLWNEVLRQCPETLELLGIVEIASQARQDAMVSFITVCRTRDRIVPADDTERVSVAEYAARLEDYCDRL